MAFKQVIIRRVGPLSWLLEPMNEPSTEPVNEPATIKDYILNTVLLLAPFWVTPLLLSIAAILPSNILQHVNSSIIPFGMVLLFIGGVPILVSGNMPSFLRLVLAAMYYTASAVITFFLGWGLAVKMLGARP